MRPRQRGALATAVVLTVTAIVVLGQLHIMAEPPWLRRMNEFEHFVLHAAFWLAGVALGSISLATFLWSAMRLSRSLRRRVVTVSGGTEARSPLSPRNLLVFGLSVLCVTAVLLAAQHGWLPEPTWLARMSPLQHFLLHLGYILSGALVAIAFLSAWGRSLLKLLRTERAWRSRQPQRPSGRSQAF